MPTILPLALTTKFSLILVFFNNFIDMLFMWFIFLKPFNFEIWQLPDSDSKDNFFSGLSTKMQFARRLFVNPEFMDFLTAFLLILKYFFTAFSNVGPRNHFKFEVFLIRFSPIKAAIGIASGKVFLISLNLTCE